ncbi:hypothetical protein D9Q98_007775 [Chlorella vulgaris]|uniref:Uncharacterized protein n=1 Tax=Chlorella vulgaris TaxID=3077 RepID=A0A9D4THM5_CHLVU|nr:hypothetical protein D9Q98_007775 [Chlorella vulgaris]
MAATSGGLVAPLFAERYWCQPTDAPCDAPTPLQAVQLGCRDPQLSPTKAASRMGNLQVLDLRTLPRDDGPPTELRARKEKLAFFERQCSRVAEGLYVGAEHVARSRDTLREAGITHIVNCVGFLYPPYFENELRYQVLYLQDTPGEDILCVLYDVFDFIEEATLGGRVLLHCSQGVSRSASLAIAYLMWKQAAAYDDVFQAVKAARGVTNPNIGFICQLLQWYKRRHSSLDASRLYRIAPQSPAAAQYLVAKPVPQYPAGVAGLDPRGAFVLQAPAALYIWVGGACPEPFVAAAHRFASQLQKYEAAAAEVVVVQQGQEPAAFWTRMAAVAGEGGGSRSGSPAPSAGGVAAAEAAVAAMLAAAAGAPLDVVESSAYDRDFELYHRSLTARDSARSGSGGRKTPRDNEGGDAATSPNDRLRKQARGVDRPPSPGKRRREPAADLTLDDMPGISLDSATAQLGKKERTLQEATSPLVLLPRTVSDRVPPPHSSDEVMSDGSSTPRGGGGGQQQWEQQQQQQQRGRHRQASNLGRAAAAGAAGGAAGGGAADGAAAVALPAGRGGKRAVPLLRLALPPQ